MGDLTSIGKTLGRSLSELEAAPLTALEKEIVVASQRWTVTPQPEKRVPIVATAFTPAQIIEVAMYCGVDSFWEIAKQFQEGIAKGKAPVINDETLQRYQHALAELRRYGFISNVQARKFEQITSLYVSLSVCEWCGLRDKDKANAEARRRGRSDVQATNYCPNTTCFAKV